MLKNKMFIFNTDLGDGEMVEGTKLDLFQYFVQECTFVSDPIMK